ncbi:serine/threonine protein kinase [Actinomyces dentalis]|uniref:serine/threonine protein kinase n=1 Tax=Actinomyces dentalis TaxID=272548 RepID=UPI000427E5BB|nr:serine/threonine protein kinase [Actinomyces dentalis]
MERLGSVYILEERIGAGAQGDVWKGHKEGSEEPLAFKKLRSELARERNVVDAFLKERDTLERVDSPHVVRLRDMVTEGETLGLVMDYVGGGDLADVIRKQGTLAPGLVASYGAAIAAGLSAIHAAGLVHRDVKPANILMDDASAPPAPRVADFGVARICDSAVSTRSTGGGAGTPLYMSPEAADGLPAAPSMDVYSLGAMLYEMCCGVPPFTGAPSALLKSHMMMNPGRPEGVPDVLWDLIGRMMSKDPAARPTADQVGRALTDAAPSLAGLPAAPRLSAPPPPVPASAVARTVLGTPVSAPSAPPLSAPSAVSASTATLPPVPVPPPAAPVAGPGGPVPPPGGVAVDRSAPGGSGAGAKSDEGKGKKKGKKKRSRAPLVVLVLILAVALVAAGVVIGARYLPRSRPVAEGPSAGPAPTSEAPPSETPSASADASARTSATATASASSTATTTMPDLVGLTTDQAKAKLPDNVKVDVVKANAPHGEKEGTVLSTDPAAGEKISDTVTLTVVGSATSSSTSGSTKTVYLADIKATEQVNTDVFDLNGKSQVHGFTKIFYSASQWSTEWNLGRHFNTMSGTIGITDNSKDSGATFTVEFYLDQELVQTETLAFGEFKDISLNVQNKLRLKVVITRTDKGSRTASVGFGDFQLQGDSDKVPSLDDLNKEH